MHAATPSRALRPSRQSSRAGRCACASATSTRCPIPRAGASPRRSSPSWRRASPCSAGGSRRLNVCGLRLSRKVVLSPFLLLLVASAASAAYDVNDVKLGAAERDIKQRFPNAHCRALEWPSRAAERRCDDSRITFGGVDGSVTFYLKGDSVEGFDVRFDQREVERVLTYLRTRYGKPLAEPPAPPPAPVSIEWKAADERARLTSEPGRRRASLLAWRGAFDDEIY